MAFIATPIVWEEKKLLVKDEIAFGGGFRYAFAQFGSSTDADGTIIFIRPLVYSIKSGELPPGIELDTATGGISGTPTSGGTFESVIQVSDSSDPPIFPRNASDPDLIQEVTLKLVVAPGPDILDIKFVGPGGEPEWVSASLAEVPLIMELANNARKAAVLLQKNLEAGKAAAELTKTFLLLQASILSTILNAIADELENLYNDLSKAGFYTLWLDGQENVPQGSGGKVKVAATKAEMQTRYARAKSASHYTKIQAQASGTYTPANSFTQTNETFPNNFAADFLEWLGKQYQSDGTPLYAGITPDKLPGTIKIEINTDSPLNIGPVKGGSILKAAIGGVETNFIKQQSPNQFLAKLMMKLEDESDPNTPYFSSSGQTGAIIMLIGIPDLSGLSNVAKIMDQVGNFVGAAVMGGWQIIKDLLKAAGIYDVDKPDDYPDPEFKMTFYGVRGAKIESAPEPEPSEPPGRSDDGQYRGRDESGRSIRKRKRPKVNFNFLKAQKTRDPSKRATLNMPKVFEVGDYLVGEDSGMAFIVTATAPDPDYVDYYSNQKTRKDLGFKTPTVLPEWLKKKNKEGETLCADQTLMLRPTALGTSVEWFGQMWPGETVRTAYKTTGIEPIFDKENGSANFGNYEAYHPIDPKKSKASQKGDYVDKKAVDEGISNKGFEGTAKEKQVRTDKTQPEGPITYTDLSGKVATEQVLTDEEGTTGLGLGSSVFSEIALAVKNLPAKPATPIPPAWGHATLVDAFEAYGEFLKYILIFAQFLRDMASTASDQIDKIIKFIDDMIKIAEEIVDSILALLAFFEALKDAGMYMLIIQDPDGSGLLQGGTDALIDAIGSATGQDATPQVDEDLNIIENPDLDLRRIKPPETLRYTMGFALVFGGPGAAVEEGFKNILKLVAPEE